MPLNPITYNTVFLSEDDLKQMSVIDSNVDEGLLTPVILLCQNIYLEKLLGTSLYVDLQNKVYALNTSGTTLTANDKFLIEAYIIPTLIWLVMMRAPVFLTYKFKNKGVQTQNSDNSQPVTDAELQTLYNQAKNASDSYSQRLIEFLQTNQGNYPAYSRNTSATDLAPATKGYKTSVYLGNSYYWPLPPGVSGGPWGGWCLDCDWSRFFS